MSKKREIITSDSNRLKGAGLEVPPSKQRMSFQQAFDRLLSYREVDSGTIADEADLAKVFPDLIEVSQVAAIGFLRGLPETKIDAEHGLSIEASWENPEGLRVELGIGYAPDTLQGKIYDPFQFVESQSGEVFLGVRNPAEPGRQLHLFISQGDGAEDSWRIFFDNMGLSGVSETLTYDPQENDRLEYNYSVDIMSRLTHEKDVAKPNGWSRLASVLVMFADELIKRVENGNQKVFENQQKDIPPRRLLS